MGLMDALFGKNPETERHDRAVELIAGVNALLRDERTFDPGLREVFWVTHLDKVEAYCAGISQAAQASPPLLPPADIQTASRVISELRTVVDSARAVSMEQAHNHRDAVRALVFSGTIAFMAQKNLRDSSVTAQWNLYVDGLTILGLSTHTRATQNSEKPDNMPGGIQSL
jgi:hypothetical protein